MKRLRRRSLYGPRRDRFHSEFGARLVLIYQDMFLSEVQPGIKRPMSTAFEIPLAAAREGVKLIIPEKGIFGMKSVEIVLPVVK
jgi:hypothetical protein